MHDEIKLAIEQSQRCQRNWDLSKEIPEEDLELFQTAVGQPPSKQNVAHYKVHFIMNRRLIEKIEPYTDGFIVSHTPVKRTITNSQSLANLVAVFEPYMDLEGLGNRHRAGYIDDLKAGINVEQASANLLHDQTVAIGIASGYLALVANQLGYATGFNGCIDPKGIQDLMGLGKPPLFLLGIGHPDPSRNRREHHTKNYLFPSFSKQEIPISVIR